MPRAINLEASDGASEVRTREVGTDGGGDGEVEDAGFGVGRMTGVEACEGALLLRKRGREVSRGE